MHVRAHLRCSWGVVGWDDGKGDYKTTRNFGNAWRGKLMKSGGFNFLHSSIKSSTETYQKPNLCHGKMLCSTSSVLFVCMSAPILEELEPMWCLHPRPLPENILYVFILTRIKNINVYSWIDKSLTNLYFPYKSILQKISIIFVLFWSEFPNRVGDILA